MPSDSRDLLRELPHLSYKGDPPWPSVQIVDRKCPLVQRLVRIVPVELRAR
jgi:hypothetical protein